MFSNGVTYSGGVLTIPANVASFTITVPTVDDSLEEASETLILTVGGSAATGTITDNDEPAPPPEPPVTPPPPPPAKPDPVPVAVPEPLPFGADLDPATDSGENDRVTNVIEPEFTINAGGRMAAGDTAVLLDPQGVRIGSATVTPEDVSKGNVNVPSIPLDDGSYTFIAQIINPDGNIKGEAPVVVTIVTDRDGVQPSVELAANNGDFNNDGVKDWEQNNVAQLPVTSILDFNAGKNAPASSFGAIIVGDVASSKGNGAVQLNPNTQLLDVAIRDIPKPLPQELTARTPVFQFSVTAEQSKTLTDITPNVPGLQTRVVIELPAGVQATGYQKFNAKTGSWLSFNDDQDLSTYDDGATLLDINGDGLIDRIVVTLTDGGPGDEDGLVNGVVVDPGLLVFQKKATPVLSVVLSNGDRYYSTNSDDIARMAKGSGNVFEGARFDALDQADGGRAVKAYKNFITGDWYFAADGDPMPYACYLPQQGSGFTAAPENQGAGSNFHLWMDNKGITQLASKAESTQLGLASKGYQDLGAVFNTTTTSAFAFDAEGYLVANRLNADVVQLVKTLAGQYQHTSDAGFIEAVESHYLAKITLVGVSATPAASASDVNAAFGSMFSL